MSFIFAVIIGILPFLLSDSNSNSLIEKDNLPESQNENHNKQTSSETINVSRIAFTGINQTGLKRKIEEISKKNNFAISSVKLNWHGEIRKVDSNNEVYIFTGGKIFIRINETCSFDFESLIIPQMRPNRKFIIEDELNNILNKFSVDNENLILTTIKKCLKEI